MDPDEFIPTRASLLGRLKDWDDQTSWREFFDTYWRLIYGVARKAGLTDAEAQDVVQETLLAVAKKMPGFIYDPAVDSFKGWLLTVTQWKIADQVRKRDNVAVRLSGAGETSALLCADMQAIWDEEWRAHLLHTALSRLKRRVQPAHYEMYYLHVIKEQSVKEVARTLRVNAAQVYLAKHRVGAALKLELKRTEEERIFPAKPDARVKSEKSS